MKKVNQTSNANLKAAVTAATGAAVSADVRVAAATAAAATAEAVATETAGTLARTAVQFRTFVNNFVVEGGEYRSFVGVCSDVGVTHPDLVKWVKKQKWQEVFAIWKEGAGYTRNSFRSEEDWETYLQLREAFLAAKKANKKASRKLAKARAALKAAKQEAIRARFVEKSAKKAYNKFRKEVKEINTAETAVMAEEKRQEKARERAEKAGPKEPPKRREAAAVAGLESMLAWIKSRKTVTETAAPKAAVKVAATETTVITETTNNLVVEANAAVEYGYMDLQTGEFVSTKGTKEFSGARFKTGTINIQLFASKVSTIDAIEEASVEAIKAGKEDSESLTQFLDKARKAIKTNILTVAEEINNLQDLVDMGRDQYQGDLDQAVDALEKAREAVEKLEEITNEFDAKKASIKVSDFEVGTDGVLKPVKIKSDKKGHKVLHGTMQQVAIDTIMVYGKEANSSGEGLHVTMTPSVTGINALVRAALKWEEDYNCPGLLVSIDPVHAGTHMDVTAFKFNRRGEFIKFAVKSRNSVAVVSGIGLKLNGIVAMSCPEEHKMENVEPFVKLFRKLSSITVDGEEFIPCLPESNAKTRNFELVWTSKKLAKIWLEVLAYASGGITSFLSDIQKVDKGLQDRSRLPLGWSPSVAKKIVVEDYGVAFINDKLDHIDGQCYGDAKLMAKLAGYSEDAKYAWQVRTETGKGQMINVKSLKQWLDFLIKAKGYKVFYAKTTAEVQGLFELHGKGIVVIVGNTEDLAIVGDNNFFKKCPQQDKFDGRGRCFVELNILANLAPTGNGSHAAWQVLSGVCAQYKSAKTGKSLRSKAAIKRLVNESIEIFKRGFKGRNIGHSMPELLNWLTGRNGLEGEAAVVAELSMKAADAAMKPIINLSAKLENEQQVVRGDASMTFAENMQNVLFAKHEYMRGSKAYKKGPGLLKAELIVPNNSKLLRNGNQRVIAVRYPHSNGYSFVMFQLVTVDQAIERINNSTLEQWQKDAIIMELKSMHGNAVMCDSTKIVLEALGGMDFDGDKITVFTEKEYKELLPVAHMRTIVAPIVTKAKDRDFVCPTGADEFEKFALLQKYMSEAEAVYVGQVADAVQVATELIGSDRATVREHIIKMIKFNNLHHSNNAPVFSYEEDIKWLPGLEGVMLDPACCTVEKLREVADRFMSETEERNYCVESVIAFAEYIVLMSGPCQGYVIDTVKKACEVFNLGGKMAEGMKLKHKKFAPSFVITMDDKAQDKEDWELSLDMTPEYILSEKLDYVTFGSSIQEEAFKAFTNAAKAEILSVFGGQNKVTWDDFEEAMKDGSGLSKVGDRINRGNKQLRDMASNCARALVAVDRKTQKAFADSNVKVVSCLDAWGEALATTAALYGTINPLAMNAHVLSKYFKSLEFKTIVEQLGIKELPVKLAFTNNDAIADALTHVGEEVLFEYDAETNRVEAVNLIEGVILPGKYSDGKYKIVQELKPCGKKFRKELFAMLPAKEVLGIKEFDSSRFVMKAAYKGSDLALANDFMEKLNEAKASNMKSCVYVNTPDKFKAIEKHLKENHKSYAFEDKMNAMYGTFMYLITLNETSDEIKVIRYMFAEKEMSQKAKDMLYGTSYCHGVIVDEETAKKKGWVNTYLLLEPFASTRKDDIAGEISKLEEAFAKDFKEMFLDEQFEKGHVGEVFAKYLAKVASDEEEIELEVTIPAWFYNNVGSADDMKHASALLALGYEKEEVEDVYGTLPTDIVGMKEEELALYCATLLK